MIKNKIKQYFAPSGLEVLGCILRNHNINILKTLYFNFKALPFHRAIHFPFVVGKKVKIREIGDIQISPDIGTFNISIGALTIFDWEHYDGRSLVFNNKGKIVFEGPVRIHPGTQIFVKSDADLTFGGYNILGQYSRLICYKHIKIGYDSVTSWDCQLMDTDFHYLKDVVANKIKKRDSFIEIGSGVFVGNNVTLCKGSKIPNNSVISSCSKVAASYIKEGENLLIAGNPAIIVDKGYKMLLSQYREIQ